MKISGYKTADRQLTFWDQPLGNHGHCRTVLGDLVEDLTARLFNGRRHKTDCTADYCPDVSAGGVYLECKAAGKSKQIFVYGGRLEKDCEFSEHHPLLYVIWHHRTNTKRYSTVEGLQRGFLRNMQCVYVVPFQEICRICREEVPKEKLNSKYYGSHGSDEVKQQYGEGYRIRLRLLQSWKVITWKSDGTAS